MDWQFRIASEAAFAGDLNAFCAGAGYPPLSADGVTVQSCDFVDLLRFDFDLIDDLVSVPAVINPATMAVTSPAITKGPHINARATALPDVDQDAAAAALATLAAQISAYFASLPTTTNAIPAQYGGGTQTWHTTAGGTVLIDPPPAFPKRVWE